MREQDLVQQLAHQPTMDHQRVLADITAWATAKDNIRAVILTGSVARNETHELSDLDVELYLREPSQLLEDRSWYPRFGDVLVVEELPNPGWHPTRLIYYVDAKIDFTIAPITALAQTAYDDAFRVLVDKDGAGSQLCTTSPVGEPISDVIFERCVNWFYAAALMEAKAVVRDEPWLAKNRDGDLKRQLLHMIEWDHKARHGWSYNTRWMGKQLDRWVDRDIRAALDHCWAPFPVADTATALLASVDLFANLSTRTAAALGLQPVDTARLRDEITRILSKTGDSTRQ
jgi:aminoglycoside 6-adenylyltransferase